MHVYLCLSTFNSNVIKNVSLKGQKNAKHFKVVLINNYWY